jgi:exodeoxyribonuclease VII small subunit
MPKKASPVSPDPVPDAAADADPVTRFEGALKELEDLVARMEHGDLPLEESLRLFERGMSLSRSCRQSLDAAELRVRNLLEAADTRDGADASASFPHTPDA